MTKITAGVLAVMVAYLIFMVLVGVYYSRYNSDTNDFYLGGRKLGPLVTAMSAEASDMSSWLLMGLPGVAYLSGVAEAAWTAIGLALGTYLNWLIVARRLRHYTAVAGNAITIPQFFSNRYKDKSNILLVIAAFLIVIFFVPYTASGFAACGKLFSVMFNIPYVYAMIGSAAIIVAYTALGGFLAASTTDLIQSIIMTVALIVVSVFGLHIAGGFDDVVANADKLQGYVSLFSSHNLNIGKSSPMSFLTIVSTLAWGLGYFGMPHVLLRFMGTKDRDKLKLSRRIATVWVVISMFVAISIGIIGLGMTRAGVIDSYETPGESEKLIINIALLLSKNGIFAVLMAGLILSGILACTMSTSDSQLLAASSSVSENIVNDFLGIKLSKKSAMLLARITVLVIAVIAVFLARDPESSVFKIVSFAWAGFGATFGPAVLFALFWKRSNRNGALAGMISGGIMVFAWKYLIAPLGGIFAIYELLPAFIVASLAIIVVSLITEAPSDEIIAEFEQVDRDLSD